MEDRTSRSSSTERPPLAVDNVMQTDVHVGGALDSQAGNVKSLRATSSLAGPDTAETAGTSQSSEADEFEGAVPDARGLEPQSTLRESARVDRVITGEPFTSPGDHRDGSGLKTTLDASEFRVKEIVFDEKIAKGYLQDSFYPVESMMHLYVSIVRARNLVAEDAGGTSINPYVKVAVGNFSLKTEVIPKDLNPEWNRVFAFSKDKLSGRFVEISVWDHPDTDGADSFLGARAFKLEEIPSKKPPENLLTPVWYKLEERPGNTRAQFGELMVFLWTGNQADSAFPDAWQSDTTDGHEIFRSLYQSPKLWYLRVHIIEAEDLLPPLYQGRTPEPLVEIQLGPLICRKFYVPAVRGTCPLWDKDLMFVAAEPFEEFLQVTVKDRSNKEKTMGETRIELDNIPRRSDSRQQIDSSWYSLGYTKNGVSQGRIHLRIYFEGGYHVFDESPDFLSCTRPTDEQLTKPPLGLLELGVIGANYLLPMHYSPVDGRTTDAYCVAKYGEKWLRTRTCTNSLFPKWIEQCSWKVYHPCTVLTVGVFDNRHVHKGIAAQAADTKDTVIGKVRIRLSTLESGRVYTNSYPLLVVTATGIRKIGKLELAVRFSCTSRINLMQTYLQPPLPAMHYLNPIDLGELETLQLEAMKLVASRLARVAPPLRPEVVRFMCDTPSHRWSQRLSKAHYSRLVDSLSSLFALQKLFDDIRTWNNPVAAVAAHIISLALLWYPEFLLPIVFFSLFLIGTWNYRFRSRLPPYFDARLSQGGDTPGLDLDELEEEFNVYTPTGNRTNLQSVLKRRYDRLKSFAGRIQHFQDNVASQGERFQALLSWRDPRATSIFVTFCLVAAVVLYLTPFRVVATLTILHVLRHPTFRNSLPAAPYNFFTYLPTQSELVLYKAQEQKLDRL